MIDLGWVASVSFLVQLDVVVAKKYKSLILIDVYNPSSLITPETATYNITRSHVFESLAFKLRIHRCSLYVSEPRLMC